jgi:hypothetical protein
MPSPSTRLATKATGAIGRIAPGLEKKLLTLHTARQPPDMLFMDKLRETPKAICPEAVVHNLGSE